VGAPLDEAEEAVFEADHVGAAPRDEALGDSADDGVEAGAIAAAGEDADAEG
jgi:hypothetical protein